MQINARNSHLLWRTVLLTGGIALTSIAGAQEPLEAFIQQTDFEDGLEYGPIPVAGEGDDSVIPMVPVREAGARFELWALGTAWDNTNLYLLDTKVINVYSPEAALTIVSDDPYVYGDPESSNYVKRTRTDQPFWVKIRVDGLLDPASDPPPNDAERYVFFSVEGRNYDMATYSGLGQDPYPLSAEGDGNRGNGNETFGPLFHELISPAPDPAAVCGEQIYKIERYAADGVPAALLAQPKIEIWPLTEVTLSLDPVDTAQTIDGKIFNDIIDPLFLTMKHLYPDSYTFAQVYPGTAVLGTVGTIIEGTERKYGTTYNPGDEETHVPQDVVISLNNLSEFAAADGVYTLEVITETPFFGRAPERLYHVTFTVDRVITLVGTPAPVKP